MAAPLTEEQRAAVLEAARRPGATRNGVARETGVSEGSVTKICTEAGISFDREQTAAAVRARVVDLRAARLGLATDLLDDVVVARGRLHVADSAKDFAEVAKAIHYLSGTHVRLVSVDKEDSAGLDEAKSMLGRLALAVGVLATEQEGDGDGAA